jgi:hypothetical protein
MISPRKTFDRWAPLQWAVADLNRGFVLAQMLDLLVLEPGERRAKGVHQHHRWLHEEFCKERMAQHKELVQ